MEIIENFSPNVVMAIVRNVLEKECKGAFKIRKLNSDRKVPVCKVRRETSRRELRIIHVGKGLVELLYGGRPKISKCEKLLIVMLLAEAKRLEN